MVKIPTNFEHEQIVVAGMMNNDECFFDTIAEINEEYFADENARSIYSKLLRYDQRPTVNMVIRDIEEPRLKSAARTFDGQWKSITEHNHSMQHIKDTYLKRQIYYMLNKVKNGFEDAKGEDLIATIQSDISGLSYGGNDQNMIFPEDRAPIALLELEERFKNPESAKGLPYCVTESNGLTEGFPSLDKSFYGAQGGDLVMIAAKTGVGKTAFAVNLARHFSFRQDYWGYYMNTEMRVEEMEARLLAPIANVRANEYMYGEMEGSKFEVQDKMNRMRQAVRSYQASKLVMSRIPDLPLHKAQGLARQVKSKVPNLQYLIVDYVGRMNVKNFNGSSWDELYEITKQLKELAMTLDIPVFILAQRNEAGDVEGAKKMRNECDGVLYFEPVEETDEDYIRNNIHDIHKDKINYKITKEKVRRDDNPRPIYVIFDKSRNYINEVR